jgi:hypothetical protein
VGPGGVCLALSQPTPSCGYRGRRQPAPPVACSAAPALVLELALSTLRAIANDLGLLLLNVCAVAAPALIIESQPWPAALGTPKAGERLNGDVSELVSSARDLNRPTLTALERAAAGTYTPRGRGLRQGVVRAQEAERAESLGFPAALSSPSGDGRVTARRICTSPGAAAGAKGSLTPTPESVCG